MYEKLPSLKEKLEKTVIKRSENLIKAETSIIDNIKHIYKLLRKDEFLRVIKETFQQYKIGKGNLFTVSYDGCRIYENKCIIHINDNPLIVIYFRDIENKKLCVLYYYPVTDRLIVQKEKYGPGYSDVDNFKYDSEKTPFLSDFEKYLYNYYLSEILEFDSALSYFVKELEGTLLEEMLEKTLKKLKL